MDNEYYMVNPLYMQYITDDKKEICHNNLLADIYYFQLLRWVKRYGAEVPAHVERYLSRLEKRPALPEGFI